MIPAPFDYEVAESVDHARELLGSREDTKALAGGHSLLPLLRLRVVRPSLLVDIGRIQELSYARDEGSQIAIGALTRHHDVATSPLVQEHNPLVSYAAGLIGDPQVRHRGTIGGSLAHGDPASDLPAKKIWSWGADADGLEWRRAMSDDGSAVIEVQAGLFRNQETYAFLEPQASIRFTEYWLPVHRIGGISRANPEAVVHLARVEDGLAHRRHARPGGRLGTAEHAGAAGRARAAPAALFAPAHIPEYRLRRLINQRLGYRNFNVFLNNHRIEEAKAALADPAQTEVPVITIAMDAGFQSLGPFNRAFKAVTGVTPTEYRRLKADAA